MTVRFYDYSALSFTLGGKTYTGEVLMGCGSYDDTADDRALREIRLGAELLGHPPPDFGYEEMTREHPTLGRITTYRDRPTPAPNGPIRVKCVAAAMRWTDDRRTERECYRLAELCHRTQLSLHIGPIIGVVLEVQTLARSRMLIDFRAPDRENPASSLTLTFGGPDLLNETLNPLTLARAVREACRDALDHELAEGILVDGVRVMDPHRHPAEPPPTLPPKRETTRDRYSASGLVPMDDPEIHATIAKLAAVYNAVPSAATLELMREFGRVLKGQDERMLREVLALERAGMLPTSFGDAQARRTYEELRRHELRFGGGTFVADELPLTPDRSDGGRKARGGTHVARARGHPPDFGAALWEGIRASEALERLVPLVGGGFAGFI